jgi:hypothetical protein
MTPLISPVARLRRHERGQLVREDGVALVEFAFVLPLLLLLIFGIIDFGKALNFKNDETHLANQAARYAAVNGCTACAGTKLNTWIASQAGATQLQTGLAAAGAVKIAFADSAGKFPDETGYNGGSLGTKNHCKTASVKVLLNFSYPFMPYLKLGSINIKGSSTMRLETNWGGNPVTGVGLAGTDIYDVMPNTASTDTC